MFSEIGRLTLRFVLAYSFISAALVIMFVSYGFTPPEPLLVMPLSVYKMAQSLVSLHGTWFLPYLLTIVGFFMLDFMLKLIVGLPVLFYKIAVLSGYPWFSIPAAMFGMLLQVSAYIALINIFLGYVSGSATS